MRPRTIRWIPISVRLLPIKSHSMPPWPTSMACGQKTKSKQCCQHEGGRISESRRQEEVINMPPRTKTPSTQVPAKIGRPTKYSPEWAERFCELLAQGQSVRQICSQPGQPDKSQVYRWLDENGDFRDQYARARSRLISWRRKFWSCRTRSRTTIRLRCSVPGCRWIVASGWRLA